MRLSRFSVYSPLVILVLADVSVCHEYRCHKPAKWWTDQFSYLRQFHFISCLELFGNLGVQDASAMFRDWA